MKYKVVILSLLFLISYSPKSQSKCQDSVGELVFQNTFYGVGIGIVFSSLWMVAKKSYDMPSQKIATGGLAGGVLGLGLGVAESFTRDCWKRTIGFDIGKKSGIQPPTIQPYYDEGKIGAEALVTYIFP